MYKNYTLMYLKCTIYVFIMMLKKVWKSHMIILSESMDIVLIDYAK